MLVRTWEDPKTEQEVAFPVSFWRGRNRFHASAEGIHVCRYTAEEALTEWKAVYERSHEVEVSTLALELWLGV